VGRKLGWIEADRRLSANLASFFCRIFLDIAYDVLGMTFYLENDLRPDVLFPPVLVVDTLVAQRLQTVILPLAG